jgi:hypothetical protein
MRCGAARARSSWIELPASALEAAKAQPPSAGDVAVAHIDHTSGIEAEVEAFLFQTKATLDVLCKVLVQ